MSGYTFSRLPVALPNPTGQKVDPWKCYPVLPVRPPAYDPEALNFAHWSFGTDAESLESVSSGHVAAAVGTMAYDANSVTTPAVNNQGIDLNIVDQQTFTAWAICRVPAGLALVMGTSAADTDTLGWWLRFNAAGQAHVVARGTTFPSGNLFMPAGVVAGTSHVFLAFAADPTNCEAMCGGGSGSRTSAGAFSPHTRDVALGALFSVAPTYSQAVRFVDAGYISGVRYSLSQMNALYAARKAAVFDQKGITVL